MSNFMEGLNISVMGILIVFAVLIILMLVLMLFKVFFYKEPQKQTQTQKASAPNAVSAPAVAPKISSAPGEMAQNELVAVIAAAVAAASGQNSTYRLQVRSIRRTGCNSPVWNAVSRKENLDSKL